MKYLKKQRSKMLDILDKLGKVVAVLMDDGTVIRKKGAASDDIDQIIKEKLSQEAQKGKQVTK
jgi:hypothetical protein